jgi:hypothetical protein
MDTEQKDVKAAENSGVDETAMVAIGTKVSKVGGDYRFDGTVVAAFTKLSGAVRYAVEDDRGVLHIYSRKNFTIVE